VAELPHAHLYRGLPPVQPHRWRWLKVSAVVLIAGAAIALPVFAFAYATHSVPSRWWGGGGRESGGYVQLFDWDSLRWIGGAFIVGGALGVSLARRWWSTLALYVVGLALWVWILQFSGFVDPYDSVESAGLTYVWFFWIFGVSAGAGVRGLIHRRRVLRASFVSQPA
jgi:hypothetical protein